MNHILVLTLINGPCPCNTSKIYLIPVLQGGRVEMNAKDRSVIVKADGKTICALSNYDDV